MMKFTLIIWVCSFLGQNMCLAPIESPILYNSWYECSRAAHKESIRILSKLGYSVVNKDKIAMKYTCKEASSI
jgi:hypothetical protein